MRISDWSSDVCSSDLGSRLCSLGFLERSLAGGDQIGQRCRRHAAPLDMQIERNGGLDLAWSQRAGGDRHPATFRTGGEEGIADIGMDETDFHSVHFSIFPRSEEHTSELQSLMRISYAVFCLK